MTQPFIFKLSRYEDREYYFDKTTTPWTLYSRATPADSWVAVLASIGQGQALTAAFTSPSTDLGTVASGTVTLDVADGPMQDLINGGAFTLAPQTGDSIIRVLITNNASAGAITTSDYDHAIGDAFTTTDADVALVESIVINGVSILRQVAVLNSV